MRITIISLFLLLSPVAFCQSAPPVNQDSLAKDVADAKRDLIDLKNLKITGWVQSQFQYAETRGVANFDGGNFAPNSDKRLMVRRGRVKFTYNGKNSQFVMQINGAERGINLVEAYAVATDPWTKAFSLVFGVMNRPFGFEINQSSSVRESPERSRYTQILMPNERDMGVKIVYAPVKGKKLHGLRLDAGFYNGQGIYVPGPTTSTVYSVPGTTPLYGVSEFDYKKDFMGRLSYYRDLNDRIRIGIGASHYNGGILYVNNRSYSDIGSNAAGNAEWKSTDTTSTHFRGTTTPRVYTGAEAFFSIKTGLGTTTLRGEYIMGTQPGTNGSSQSPFFDIQLGDTYIRQFSGAYGYFIHRIGKSKHEIVYKYEYYDPNTKVTGKDIKGGRSFSTADIRFDQMGFGYNYYMYENVKFMFYYSVIRNEATSLASTNPASDYSHDIKDNILTIRMQYKF